MRQRLQKRWALISVLCAATALAQSDAAQGDDASPAPKAEAPDKPVKAEAAPARRAEISPELLALEKQRAFHTAQTFFTSLIASDARAALRQTALPFTLEDRRYTSLDELLDAWLKELRNKRTDLLTLYGLDIYTPQEMEKAFGKPPARLAQFSYRDAKYIGVANLSGHAAIVVMREGGRGYLISGFTD